MRNQLIATVAAAGLLAMAGAAQAQVVGHVGANYGRVELDAGALGEGDLDAFQGEGAVSFDLGALRAQIDGLVTVVDGQGDDATLVSGTAHLNGKADKALFGGFAGVTNSDGVTLWAVGPEAQIDLGESTVLYGQGAYGQVDDLGDVDFWAGRVELRQFFSDNFKVQGSLGYTSADFGPASVDMWNAGLDAEYQFAGTPWSVIGGYEHAELDDADLQTDTFRIGVRYTFGGTLRDQDRAGASLGSVANLFGGTLGQTLIAAFGSVAP